MIETRDFPVDTSASAPLNVPDKFTIKCRAEEVMQDVEKNSRGCRPLHLEGRTKRQQRSSKTRATPSGNCPDRHHQHNDYFTARAILAALLFLFPLIAARAGTNNQRAEKEARAYLVPCDEDSKNEQAVCETHQSMFIHNFVAARAADIRGMIAIADAFHGPPDRSEENYLLWLGFPVEPLESCAWRLLVYVKARGDEARELARQAIFDLPEATRIRCKERAEAIDQEFRTRPVKRPGTNWYPAADKLKPSERLHR